MNFKISLPSLLLAFGLSQSNTISQHEFGGNLGWGSPFGVSFQYSNNLNSNNQIGAAIGVSLAGFKYGTEYKHFFNADANFNPYIGLAGSIAGGVSEVTLNVNQDTALYKMNGGSTIHPRLGFRIKLNSNLNLYANTGYGIVLSGGGTKYIEGSTKPSIKDFAEITSLGGLEISASLSLGF